MYLYLFMYALRCQSGSCPDSRILRIVVHLISMSLRPIQLSFNNTVFHYTSFFNYISRPGRPPTNTCSHPPQRKHRASTQARS